MVEQKPMLCLSKFLALTDGVCYLPQPFPIGDVEVGYCGFGVGSLDTYGFNCMHSTASDAGS